MQKQASETQTAFALRLIRHEAWVDGHDAACSVSMDPCPYHTNPYADPMEN